MNMRWILTAALFGLITCAGPGEETGGTQFGPSEAESEIRNAFGITGALPTIDLLIRLAESRGMRHEPRLYDRSLKYCQVGRRRSDLSMEVFYAGRDNNREATLNYVAAYGSDRQVVCIETRHAYLGL